MGYGEKLMDPMTNRCMGVADGYRCRNPGIYQGRCHLHISNRLCNYVNPVTKKACPVVAVRRGRCNAHGGGEKCLHIDKNGVQCENLRRRRGRCARHYEPARPRKKKNEKSGVKK